VRKQKPKGNNRVGRSAAFVLLFLVFYLHPWFIGVVAGLSDVYALYATHCRWSIYSLHGLGFGKKESGAVVLRIFMVSCDTALVYLVFGERLVWYSVAVKF